MGHRPERPKEVNQMTIKAKVGDVEFILETEADVRAFLAATSNGAAMSQPGLPPETFVQKLRNFYRRLGSKPLQLAMIRALAGEPEGLLDAQLREAVSIDSNQKLGGIMGGIAKNASGVGLALEQVLVKRKLATGAYHYRLTPDMRDAVLNAKSGQ